MTAIWSKDSPSWGSGLRVQRNLYALLVSLAMTGDRLVCPSCDSPLDTLTTGACEVDRAVPALDYCPSNICLLCRACNQSRAELQSVGRDWTHADRYADDVRRASESVTVPSVRTAKRWHAERRIVNASVSRYA